MSPGGSKPVQPSWLRCPSPGGCGSGAQRRSAQSGAEREFKSHQEEKWQNFSSSGPESLVAGVKSERRELEWKSRAAETSWRENGRDHCNCTEQTQCLVQPQSLQRRIFLPFTKEIWGSGPSWDCSQVFSSLAFFSAL